MKRWFFPFAALLSLVLFVGSFSCLLPGRRAVRLWLAPERADFLVMEGGGVFWVAQKVTPPPADAWWTTDLSEYGTVNLRSGGEQLAGMTSMGQLPRRGRFGFASFATSAGRIMFGRPDGKTATCAFFYDCVGAPLWAVALATAVAPGAWLFVHLRRLRSRTFADRGLCVTCGYDLRASGERCPECGADIAPLHPSASTPPPRGAV